MSDYEYKGLMAEFWDLLRGDTSNWDDRFFYLEMIKQYGQPVLDVGCGTGRLLLDYLSQGIDIEGVDNSPEMLEICQHKARKLGLQPVLYEQYMEALALPRLYKTILVPSSSLQLIIEPEMARLVVQNLADHLVPQGALVAPFMAIHNPADPLENESETRVTRPEDGAVIRRVSWTRYHPDKEVEESRDLYQVLVDGQVVAEEKHERNPAARNYTQEQARDLFESAGLRVEHMYKEFTLETAQANDWIITLVGVKS
jgi:2-polyprenyl-3-methyl-5-hydroxy-6-metoxy-1,4-benzoquinol methylase